MDYLYLQTYILKKDVKESIVFDDSLTVKDKSEILTAVFNHKELLSFFDDSLSSFHSKNYIIEVDKDSDFGLNVNSRDKKFEVEQKQQQQKRRLRGKSHSTAECNGWNILYYKNIGGTVVVRGSLTYGYESISFSYELNIVNGMWNINEDKSTFQHMIGISE